MYNWLFLKIKFIKIDLYIFAVDLLHRKKNKKAKRLEVKNKQNNSYHVMQCGNAVLQD